MQEILKNILDFNSIYVLIFTSSKFFKIKVKLPPIRNLHTAEKNRQETQQTI